MAVDEAHSADEALSVVVERGYRVAACPLEDLGVAAARVSAAFGVERDAGVARSVFSQISVEALLLLLLHGVLEADVLCTGSTAVVVTRLLRESWTSRR